MIKSTVKSIIYASANIIDILISPFVFVSSLIFLFIRKVGIINFPLAKKIFIKVGIFPIWDQYYEPLFNFSKLSHSLRGERTLPGIKLNDEVQLTTLRGLKKYSHELETKSNFSPIPEIGQFNFKNGSYGTGDAEFLYCFIRSRKPKKIIEVGSGNSTIMVRHAIEMNVEEDPAYQVTHICIEPYEMPWLEKSGVEVLRSKVEDCDTTIFEGLSAGDLLFIDSSHIIRPQGDVLFEYLQILPILKKGVIVHIHDIFTPRDYLDSWLIDDCKLWNEQYLLEAFLSQNNEYQIIAALNYLHHKYFDELKLVCPFLTENREPGAFYIEKI